ncbi:MAG: GDYXXLXY domain-containing protein [Candidatus Rokubacteria bacterium]|nr:GDYXXLXY domain-containing protein [Candidatus Rokubacteria bacterium]
MKGVAALTPLRERAPWGGSPRQAPRGPPSRLTRLAGSRIIRANGSVQYGIESFFVDPEGARELEQGARRGTLRMRVVVDSQGRGVLRGVVAERG